MELKLANIHNSFPTECSPLSETELRPLRRFFESQQRDKLPPAVFVRDGREELLGDGNHRIALTKEYGGHFLGLVYEVGETHADDVVSYEIDEEFLAKARKKRQEAISHGIITFEDLLNLRPRTIVRRRRS